MGYAQWLKDFLHNHRPHLSETVVYKDLLVQQSQMMLNRKVYTMALSMRTQAIRKLWIWLRYRREFGLTLKAIALAAIKSRRLRKITLN